MKPVRSYFAFLPLFAAAAALAWAGSASAQTEMTPTQPAQSAQSADSAPQPMAAIVDPGYPRALTRAEVRQDLVNAERSGELERLNETVYQGR